MSIFRIQAMAETMGGSETPHFIGSVISAVAGYASAKKTADEAKDNAREANDFTKEQLQNRHQWEVADLKAAGLNPVLSAHGTPSIGSSAKADVINPMETALQAANSAANLRLVNEQIKNLRADTGKKVAEQNTSDNLGALYAQQYRIGKAGEVASKIEENIDKTWYGKVLRYMGRLNPLSQMAGNSAQAIKMFAK